MRVLLLTLGLMVGCSKSSPHLVGTCIATNLGVPSAFTYLVVGYAGKRAVVCQTSFGGRFSSYGGNYWYGCRVDTIGIFPAYKAVQCPDIPFEESYWEEYYKKNLEGLK